MKEPRFSSIQPIDRNIIRCFTPGQSGPGSNGNKGVLHIPQSSSLSGTSPSDCLVSYLGHSLGGGYPSAEVQSLYSIAPAHWAINYLDNPCQIEGHLNKTGYIVG